MKNFKSTYFLLIILTLYTAGLAQTVKPSPDYLNVPGPILFENKSYNLNWSSHPAANFYKQEYIAKGDKTETYNVMILMDVVTGNAILKDVVSAKIAELKKMKETNPVVNYEIISNPKTGEYMLDFLLTANGPDGSISIAERNVYRYKTLAGNTGKKGVMLFGVSTRAYGAAVPAFFTTLKTNRKELMNKVAEYKMPLITLKN